jgi:hypothetical protein
MANGRHFRSGVASQLHAQRFYGQRAAFGSGLQGNSTLNALWPTGGIFVPELQNNSTLNAL